MRIVEILKLFLLLIFVEAGIGKEEKDRKEYEKTRDLFSLLENKTSSTIINSGVESIGNENERDGRDEIYFNKVEHLLAILKHEGSIPVSLFGRVVTDFIGKPPEPDILSKLEQEELVELVYRSESWVKITPLGVNMVYDVMTSCWDKVPRRWREAIHRNALISSTLAIEENLMQKLLFVHRAPLQKDFLSLRNLHSKGFEVRADKKTKESYAVKGKEFIERLAAILCRLEASYPETVENWRNDVLRFLLFHTNPLAREHEIAKFNRAYEISSLHYTKGQGLSGCPIGLPAQCATAFKDDPDCLLPTRRLSSEKTGIVVTILPFFRPYIRSPLIVCEITANAKARREETEEKTEKKDKWTIIEQEKCEMLNILNSIAKELEDMSQITGIGLETVWKISTAVGIKSRGEEVTLFFESESEPLRWYEKGVARLTYRQVKDMILTLEAEIIKSGGKL